jgi:hypothetical protein
MKYSDTVAMEFTQDIRCALTHIHEILPNIGHQMSED